MAIGSSSEGGNDFLHPDQHWYCFDDNRDEIMRQGKVYVFQSAAIILLEVK